MSALYLKYRTQDMKPGNNNKTPIFYDQGFILVDPSRENWNCIFAEIEKLNDKLEQLGIDALRKADDV